MHQEPRPERRAQRGYLAAYPAMRHKKRHPPLQAHGAAG